MVDVDLNKVRILAESAERRARDYHIKHQNFIGEGNPPSARSALNDFFYWSGKATSYRGIIAMCELQQIVEDELDSEGSCP